MAYTSSVLGRQEELHVVKPTTTVEEGNLIKVQLKFYFLRDNIASAFTLFLAHCFLPTALEALVENRITGFPVIDDDWKLV